MMIHQHFSSSSMQNKFRSDEDIHDNENDDSDYSLRYSTSSSHSSFSYDSIHSNGEHFRYYRTSSFHDQQQSNAQSDYRHLHVGAGGMSFLHHRRLTNEEIRSSHSRSSSINDHDASPIESFQHTQNNTSNNRRSSITNCQEHFHSPRPTLSPRLSSSATTGQNHMTDLPHSAVGNSNHNSDNHSTIVGPKGFDHQNLTKDHSHLSNIPDLQKKSFLSSLPSHDHNMSTSSRPEKSAFVSLHNHPSSNHVKSNRILHNEESSNQRRLHSPVKPRVRIAQPSHDIMPGFESKLLMMSQPFNLSQPRRNLFALQDGLAFMSYAAQAITQDEFSKCFVPKPRENLWSAILRGPGYIAGFLVRYVILFPFRLVLLLACTMAFFTVLPIVLTAKNERWQRWLFKMYCKAFVASWGSRIRVHGQKPRLSEPHVFVSNHTSFIDYIVLSSHEFPHAIVGQKHGGLIGYFQSSILSLNGSLMFNRGEKNDRAILAQKMRQHVQNSANVPLLIFPEGTCVNNEYTVLFHKGAFDLGVSVCPVAIRYDKSWADAYWHTKTQTFTMHLLYLMTRWALVVDIWYLPPRPKSTNQSAVAFSNQVKAEISTTAGLKNLSWDGYFKNFAPPVEKRERLKENPQLRYGAVLKNRLKTSTHQGRRGHVRRSSSVIEALTTAPSTGRDGNPAPPVVVPKPLHLMLFDSSLKQALFSTSKKKHSSPDGGGPMAGSEEDVSNDRITLIQNRILMALQDQDHRMDMIDAISDTRHDVVQTWKQHTKKIKHVIDFDENSAEQQTQTSGNIKQLHSKDTRPGTLSENSQQGLIRFLEDFDEDIERRRMENSSWRAWFRQRILAQKKKQQQQQREELLEPSQVEPLPKTPHSRIVTSYERSVTPGEDSGLRHRTLSSSKTAVDSPGITRTVSESRSTARQHDDRSSSPGSSNTVFGLVSSLLGSPELTGIKPNFLSPAVVGDFALGHFVSRSDETDESHHADKDEASSVSP